LCIIYLLIAEAWGKGVANLLMIEIEVFFKLRRICVGLAGKLQIITEVMSEGAIVMGTADEQADTVG
jgi:hypothetical protein